MPVVIGIDPGLDGALSIYDLDKHEVVQIEDMPTRRILTRSKKEVRRIDKVDLCNFFEVAQMFSVRMVLMEQMAGRKGQGADAGIQLGIGAGIIQGICIALKLPFDEISPSVWKREYGVPGKLVDGKQDKASLAAIVKRAEELIPSARAFFKGPNGGLKVDRAEAAMLSKYAAEHVLNIKV